MSTTSGRGAPARGSAARAWGRALLGGAVMAGALGAGNALGEAPARTVGAEGHLRQLLPAVLVSTLAVPVVPLLWAGRPAGLRPLGLGPWSSAPRVFFYGMAVTVCCAAVVLGVGTALGWVRWSEPDPAALAMFLARNAVAPLWTAIGTHVAFLSVNRVLFEGAARGAGWSAEVGPDHAAVLDLGYLAVTATVFVGARAVSSRGRGADAAAAYRARAIPDSET
ncbi:hypothetical protein AB0G85_03210 [Streptomyces sioyaensis]|uniref:hypothetical protein n=1 Tax=Streptomyces sioyaensis TaxID=67364 RepID=UPI0033D02A87